MQNDKSIAWFLEKLQGTGGKAVRAPYHVGPEGHVGMWNFTPAELLSPWSFENCSDITGLPFKRLFWSFCGKRSAVKEGEMNYERLQ